MPNIPPRRRGRPPSGAREAILHATLDLLRNEGLAYATTTEISKRAGVSEASIHYHFQGKAELLEAAIILGLEPIWAFDSEAAGGAGERPAEQVLLEIAETLERFFDTIVPIVGAAQGDWRLRQSLNERLEASGHGPHRGMQLIERYLQAAQHSGQISNDADIDAAALLLLGACLLRAWQRRLLTAAQKPTLPGLDRAVGALIEGLDSPTPR